MTRRAKERIIVLLLAGCAGSGMIVLLVILGTVVWKGGPAPTPSFLVEASRDFGTAGGVGVQILGTVLLMGGAAVLSLPLALGTVLFQTEYIVSSRFQAILNTLVHALNGTPTILFGLMGYWVFGMWLDTGVSWLTGVLILAVMILPTLHVAIKDAVESIPVSYREAARGLGLNTWQEIRAVVLPQSLAGVVTGTLLGLARAAGETAAIMFTATAFSGAGWPRSLSDPVATLQTHILILAQEAVDPAARAQAWGAAMVLLALVFILVAGAMGVRARLTRRAEG